jgi:hypothetical protein
MVSELPIAERLASEGLKWLSMQNRLATQILELRALERDRESAEKALARAQTEQLGDDEVHRRENRWSEIDDQLSVAKGELGVTLNALLGQPYERIEELNL